MNYEFVDFTSNEDEMLFAETIIGEKAHEFLNSELGRYLKGCAIQDIKDSAFALLDVDPEDKSLISKIQFKAMLAKNFLDWVNEAINRGDTARQMLLIKKEEI